MCLFSLSIPISTSKALGSGSSGSAVSISVMCSCTLHCIHQTVHEQLNTMWYTPNWSWAAKMFMGSHTSCGIHKHDYVQLYTPNCLWTAVSYMVYTKLFMCSFTSSGIYQIVYKQLYITWYTPYFWGTAVAQWLRCCATNRKVAGSIPHGVIGIFHLHNPTDRTMALGSTQPLTEMSTRRISWG